MSFSQCVEDTSRQDTYSHCRTELQILSQSQNNYPEIEYNINV